MWRIYTLLRPECWTVLSLKDAAAKIDRWRTEYDHYRPHSSLDDMTPAEYVEKCLVSIKNKLSLPGASVPSQMIFAAEKQPSTVSEKSFSRNSIKSS